ncbi:uncharacterized protein L969DRAFT_621666 [Mixia osmundae IAM 14324]|uniref:Abscisic acid G-protein coupled receptor-like domain-containing protein n=1 Tax=Mixia osmundae (strain CBS 9802 / IAM 14324 / JCM 22182 / KY 12970) TaxID=764103 RepID=G7E8H2_MIXOS|nr:uncharacterized protein L969DRAFT_621666 [Mixia osmundae IAM 14324]KEI39234.1 hypothetical protein L969DRAFT_621666 [Mixia osmundae IAM 14324]GAA99132.1 hypothetical protein E5Q_05822 [Mixia osmundae IAM 14324]
MAGRLGKTVEQIVLLLLRGAFFYVARLYLRRSLFRDLRQVIRDDQLSSQPRSRSANVHSNGSRSALQTPDLGRRKSGTHAVSPYSDDGSPSPSSPLNDRGLRSYPWMTPNMSSDRAASDSLLPISTSTSGSVTPIPGEGGRAKSTQSRTVMSQLSDGVFCLCFSESATLFALVLSGNLFDQQILYFNWTLSLGALLLLIVVLIPLALCILLTYRRTNIRTANARQLKVTATLTLVPFVLYLFAFFKLGEMLGDAFGVQPGQHTFGVFNSVLERICVPGVLLIASLSGAGCVQTAWDGYEWRARYRGMAISDQHIVDAERSLQHTRRDLAERRQELDEAEEAAEQSAPRSLLSKLWSSDPASSKCAALNAEVQGLSSMEYQMSQDVHSMYKRKEAQELQKTLKGKLWVATSWLFVVYCVWRVLVSIINLLTPSSNKSGGTTNDFLTLLLAKLASEVNVDLDVHAWSALIGLALIGGILVANMRYVLVAISRVFKRTSSGISTSFMTLFLSQLMAIYLITSMISLPSAQASDTDTATSQLLASLPESSTFRRMFDLVLLIAATLTFAVRFIGRKLTTDDEYMLEGLSSHV